MLVAISIPIFTSQLEKSREAVDASNIRAAYAEVMTEAMTNDKTGCYKDVTMKQSQQKWQNAQNVFPENLLAPTATSVAGATFNSTIGSDTTIATGTADQKVYVVYVPAKDATTPAYVKISTEAGTGTNLGTPTA